MGSFFYPRYFTKGCIRYIDISPNVEDYKLSTNANVSNSFMI